MTNKEAIKVLENHISPYDDCKADNEANQAIRLAIKALGNSSWIPVTERLPDKMGSYITTIDCGKYGFATGQRYFFNDEIGWNDKDVIAWMPLPEPYTKEDSGHEKYNQ
ncbi:DUF551 domain-containing protein [Methanobrevibacter sp.]|uniref:DUF551 domain-containing protein n=1 Tax=Methanobrevibacter sp. TaxID=66852 RepID=UPI0038901884